ncbi:MAG: hypothetical protein QG650_581 [Patescibacteria group bacterium]|nr:hypothetical protein [Patescibacteria group bacterium]
MKNFFRCILLFLVFSVPAMAEEPADSKPMSQEEAVAFFKGEVKGENANWQVRFKFDADGTVWGTNQNGGSDDGKYAIEDGKICFKWRRWQDSCGSLARQPDGAVRQILANGNLRMTFRNN